MLKMYSKVLLPGVVLLTGCATPSPVENSAIQTESSNYEMKYNYAIEFMKKDQLDKAEPQMAALTRDHPQFAGPWINLCIIYSEARRFSDAETACQQALKKNGKMNQARNQLGIIYRKQGRFEDARRIYQESLQQDSEYPQAHYNLGILFDLYLQDSELAIKHYQHYLDLAGNKDKKVKRWIRQLNKELNKSR